MQDKEQKIYDEQSRIKEAMLYAILRTGDDWNGENPYHPMAAKVQIAESKKFKKIYDDFISGRQ